MQKVLSILALTALLTGCASQCERACILGWGPGSPSFDAVALASDRADPCQVGMTPERRTELGRPEGYQRPSWCGAGRKIQRADIYNPQGQRIGQIRY